MLEMAQIAQQRLDEVRRYILAVSEHGIFSAIDVAQMSVTIDEISDQLR